MENLNITQIVESSPIERLSGSANTKVFSKIKDSFVDDEQRLFLSGFYVYLNYHPTTDFVVDIDDIWKYLGFYSKSNAVRLLTSTYKIGHDYLDDSDNYKDRLMSVKSKKKYSVGGQNIKKYHMNIRTFKQFCLKANTKKADMIHNYYLRLEEMLFEALEEEAIDLKNMMTIEKERKQKAVETAIVQQFPVNTECIYFGTISNTNEESESLVKFGHTNDLKTRVQCHHKDYESFYLTNAFRVENKVEIENLIKSHSKIKSQLRMIQVKGRNRTEIIAYDEVFTIETLTKTIKDIIDGQTYNIENFKKILKRNQLLEQEMSIIKDEKSYLKNNIQEITKELEVKGDRIMIQQQEINELKEKNKELNHIIETNLTLHENDFDNELLPNNEMTEMFNKFIDEQCIVRTDVDERSVHLEGRFRIWKQEKPKKEVLKEFKHYLGVRFKATKKDGHHGFHGVKLREMKYELPPEKNNITRFISHACTFSDTARVLNSTLLTEYQKWKTELNIPVSNNDMKELKAFLDSSKHTLKAVVHTQVGTNEGYYGIDLKTQGYTPNYKSTTGKKVYKREVGTNFLIKEWNSIADAATHEGIHKTAMSRITRAETPKGDYYYSLK